MWCEWHAAAGRGQPNDSYLWINGCRCKENHQRCSLKASEGFFFSVAHIITHVELLSWVWKGHWQSTTQANGGNWSGCETEWVRCSSCTLSHFGRGWLNKTIHSKKDEASSYSNPPWCNSDLSVHWALTLFQQLSSLLCLHMLLVYFDPVNVMKAWILFNFDMNAFVFQLTWKAKNKKQPDSVWFESPCVNPSGLHIMMWVVIYQTTSVSSSLAHRSPSDWEEADPSESGKKKKRKSNPTLESM